MIKYKDIKMCYLSTQSDQDLKIEWLLKLDQYISD